MATISQAYDHPSYIVRTVIGMGEGGANVAFAKYVANVPCVAYSAQYTVTTVGTTTASATTAVQFVKISGTTTTTAKFVQLSSANTAFVTTTNVLLSTAAGGLSLAQGDILECLPNSDTTSKGVVSYEIGLAIGANLTQ